MDKSTSVTEARISEEWINRDSRESVAEQRKEEDEGEKQRGNQSDGVERITVKENIDGESEMAVEEDRCQLGAAMYYG